MLTVLLTAAGLYILMLVTWLFYLAAMSLIPIKDQLTGFVKFNGYILISIGVTLDISVNLIIGTLLFLELPKELVFTKRLQRHKLDDTAWKYKVACWLCTNLLNPFDHNHC